MQVYQNAAIRNQRVPRCEFALQCKVRAPNGHLSFLVAKQLGNKVDETPFITTGEAAPEIVQVKFLTFTSFPASSNQWRGPDKCPPPFPMKIVLFRIARE